MTHAAEFTSPADEQRKRRVPAWVWIVVVCCLLPVFLGGYWSHYKKPWLMDDFRAGYDVGAAAESLVVGKNDDPCAEAMAVRYGGQPMYDQFITPEDQSAFYLGCSRGLHGVSNDWWNVSGYMNA